MRVRLALLLAVGACLALPVAASAHPAPTNIMGITLGNATAALTHTPPNDGGANFTTSRNMKLLGFSERRVAPNDFPRFNTDLAFWGDRAYQGQFNGFRIIDIDDPRRPREILNYQDCGTVGQGDVVVWGNILVRSWDVNTTTALPAQTCDGETVPAGTPGQPPDFGNGFEGLHVFDISDPGNPDLVASVDLKCGSHTATAVPDLGNRRLLVYSTPSDAVCDGIDVVEVPLSRPEEAEFLRFEYSGRNAANADGFHCHDTGVILGRANKMACAGGVGFAVWSLGGRDGGSRDNPRFLYNYAVPEIRDENPPNFDNPTGHSASFSWDGETIIFGHEPGGGLQARCKATGEPLTNGANPGPGVQSDDMKSFFFYDTDSGEPLGKWTAVRPQLQTENCTLHNYNVVPTKHDDILVHGSYQSGIGVLDFSNPARAREIAFADPAPLPPTQTGGTQDGGDWSSYFYNGVIYEADITRGLFTWRLDERDTERAFKLRHLNPQTQEFTIGAKKDDHRWNEDDRWEDRD
jgi:LVIVD repeat